MKSSPLRLASATFALALASVASAATVPFTETFGTTLSGWTQTGGATWSQNTVAGTYTATASTAGSFVSTVQLTNVNSTTFAPGTSFTVSSSFQVTDGAASAAHEYYGLALFGTPASLGSSFYLADVQRSGVIRLISLFGANADFTGGGSVSTGQGTLALNTTYTLQFTGTYGNDGSLAMTFSLLGSGGAVIKSVGATDLTPLTGQHFGFRNNLTTGGDAVSVVYDSLSIASAVPEPSAFGAFLGLAALGATGLRRRRAADLG